VPANSPGSRARQAQFTVDRLPVFGLPRRCTLDQIAVSRVRLISTSPDRAIRVTAKVHRIARAHEAGDEERGREPHAQQRHGVAVNRL
jgi:hypothetical protein